MCSMYGRMLNSLTLCIFCSSSSSSSLCPLDDSLHSHRLVLLSFQRLGLQAHVSREVCTCGGCGNSCNPRLWSFYQSPGIYDKSKPIAFIPFVGPFQKINKWVKNQKQPRPIFQHICLGAQSFEHANVLSEKNNFSSLGGPGVTIFGPDDLHPMYQHV